MDDLISRQKAIDAINNKMPSYSGANAQWKNGYLIGCSEACKIIHDIPSVQPEPGEWIEDAQQFHVEKTYRCSKCGHPAWGYIEKTKYCPGCGAFMGGDPGC